MINQLSENKKRQLKKLSTAKGRNERGLFIVEGERSLREIIASGKMHPVAIIAEDSWIEHHREYTELHEVYRASRNDIIEISNLASAGTVLAIFEKIEISPPSLGEIARNLSLALDDIQDPGNMGTIIRLADWWGIEYVFCSKCCVDIYNPKVIQSAMGAISRVKCVTVDNLKAFLCDCREIGMEIYGSFLEGENIFTSSLSSNGIIVMGNEGNGITPQVASTVTRRITIPSFPADQEHVESLNVAMATGIIMSRFRMLQFIHKGVECSPKNL